MHVTSNYVQEGSPADATPYANHTMYYNSIGAHEDRLKNLHFVYALTVRALNLVHEQLLDHDYMSGMCSIKDARTQELVTSLLTKTIGECALS